VTHILRVKYAETARDRPRQSAYADFTAASSDHLGSRRAAHAGVK